jgi:hypothetical protein
MDNSESIPLLLQAGGGLTNIVGDLEVTGATTTNALTANGMITANDGITTSEPVLIGNRLLGSVDATPQGNFWMGLRGSATELQRLAIAINGYNTTGIVNNVALTVGGSSQLTATSTDVTIHNSTKALSDFYIGANSSAWNSTYTKGLYMRYSTNGGQDSGYIQCIDRSTVTRKPLAFEASSYSFNTGNVTVQNSIQAKNYARQNWNMNALGLAGTPLGGAVAWKIATVGPTSYASNFGQLMIKGMIGGWTTVNQMNIDLMFGTRGSTLVMGTVNCPLYATTAGVIDIVYVMNGGFFDVYLCVLSSNYYSFDLEVASSGCQSVNNVILYDPSTTSYGSLPSDRTSITGLAPTFFTKNSRAFVGAGDDILDDGVVSNNNGNTYVSRYLGVVSNNTGGRGYTNLFMNSYLRTSDGGALCCTLRNDAGDLRLQGGGIEEGITVKSDGNVLASKGLLVGNSSIVNLTSPTANLTINAKYSGTGYENSGIMINASDNSPSNYWMKIFPYTTTGGVVGYAFRKYDGGTSYDSICINKNGYVGILTNSPTAPLDIQGIINIGVWNGLYDSIIFNRGTTAGSYPNISCQDNTFFMYSSSAGGWLSDTAVGDIGIKTLPGRSIRFGADGGNVSTMWLNNSLVNINKNLYLQSVPQTDWVYGTRTLCLDSNNRVAVSSSVGYTVSQQNFISWAGGANYTNAFYRHNPYVNASIRIRYSMYSSSTGQQVPYVRLYSQSTGIMWYYASTSYTNVTYQHTTFYFEINFNNSIASTTGWFDVYVYNNGNCITDSNDQLMIWVSTNVGSNF